MEPDNATIITANKKRNNALKSAYNPIDGIGCHGERVKIIITDAPIICQWVPIKMIEENPWTKELAANKSLAAFLEKEKKSNDLFDTLWKEWITLRIKYDFEFWAILFCTIKDKMGARFIPFRLNHAQRKLLNKMESMRLLNRPIRIILLKARQWGGSTLVQMYMAWIQLVHRRNWNSVICAHIKDAAQNIKGMYSHLLERYPAWLLSDNPCEIRFAPYERMVNTSIITATGCKVTIGSAESPESIRGNDAAMAHLTEVAFWANSSNKSPESVIRSISGTIALIPYSLVVLESTANGTGSYFHRECERAKRGESDKEFLFVAWWEIEMYAKPIDPVELDFFITSLTPYEKSLWQMGATLEGINWYREKRKEYGDHSDMMAEYPSDDIEAFAHSGERVFDLHQIQAMRSECREPLYIGELYGYSNQGETSLKELRFVAENGGSLQIWEMPETKCSIRRRYISVVDIGGRSSKADYSVVAVFDRAPMLHGEGPHIVAQWRGHLDHDLLTWKATQIATFYNKSLLVIESNTLETERTDGDGAAYILDTVAQVYSNLYARTTQSPGSIGGGTLKWGFHTNRATKALVIAHQINMVRERGYVERDTQALYEHDVYEKKSNGSYGAIEGHHDDILITRCIGNYICYTEPLPYDTQQQSALKKRV